MTKIKLTALPSILIATILLLSSCRRDDIENQSIYSKSGIIMNSAQENNPLNTSSASGLMDVSYSKLSRTLSYKVTWKDLTDSVFLMHIHGLAPAGFNAGVAQNIVVTPSPPPAAAGNVGLGIFPQKLSSGRLNFTKSGSISATLFVDGVAIKEADLLNGMYYMNIHTSAFPGGEIRGQITFQ